MLLLVDAGGLTFPLPEVPPALLGVTFGLRLISATLIFLEILRRIFRGEGRCLHFALLPYTAVLLLWNYPLMWRFELLFLPLFLWTAKQVIDRWKTTVSAALATGGLSAEKLLAFGYLAVAACWLLASGYAYAWDIPRQHRQGLARRSAELSERREAFAWLREHSDSSDSVIAYEDALLYLETGRKAIRAINLTTRCAYFPDERYMDIELARITDTARHLGARYWLRTAGDYSTEPAATSEALKRATDEVLRAHREVFRSSSGGSAIYELSWAGH